MNAAPSNNDQPVKPDKEYALQIAVVLVVLVAGATVIYKVKTTFPNVTGPVTLVLEKSLDHGSWSPVVTNTVVLNGTNAIEFFRSDMTDPSAFYRAKLLK